MDQLSQATIINTNHKDLLTHVEVNSDGTLLAIASLEKIVNIYRRKNRNDQWTRFETLKTHGGYVSKCRFCHPFRGRILATCSFDTKIHIFQEDSTNVYGLKRRAVLNCNNSAVTDIQFCPYYLQNMLLAACTSAGHVLVFEAPDPLNISSWNTLYEVQLGEFRLSTLSWDRNRFSYHPSLAVGSNDPNAALESRLAIFEVDFNKQMLSEKLSFELGSNDEIVRCVSYAPSSSALYSKLAVATRFTVYIYVILFEKSQMTSKYHLKERPILVGKILDDEVDSFEVVSVLWNTQGSALSVQYNDGNIRIYKQMYNYGWERTAIISASEDLPSCD